MQSDPVNLQWTQSQRTHQTAHFSFLVHLHISHIFGYNEAAQGPGAGPTLLQNAIRYSLNLELSSFGHAISRNSSEFSLWSSRWSPMLQRNTHCHLFICSRCARIYMCCVYLFGGNCFGLSSFWSNLLEKFRKKLLIEIRHPIYASNLPSEFLLELSQKLFFYFISEKYPQIYLIWNSHPVKCEQSNSKTSSEVSLWSSRWSPILQRRVLVF